METTNLSLYYILRPPKNPDKLAPAIFLLHGYGSDEADLYSFAPELPDNCYVFSVRAPHALQPFGYCWYEINFGASFGKWSNVEQAVESRERMKAFIEEATHSYSLDPKQITLLGFSQGTVLSYAIALSYPELIKNVVALSGYIDENVMIGEFREKDHQHLSIYASHGQVDQVIPPAWAQKSPEILKGLGIEHVYQEFPTGHGVSLDNFHSLLSWLKLRT